MGEGGKTSQDASYVPLTAPPHEGIQDEIDFLSVATMVQIFGMAEGLLGEKR